MSSLPMLWRAAALRRRPAPLFEGCALRKLHRDGAGNVVVLDGLSFTIEEGITAIVGPSGSGKSTLLHLLAGLDRPDAGTLAFRGEALPAADSRRLAAYRASRVSLVWQEFHLLRHLTAEENVALPRMCRGVAWGDAVSAARAFLARVGLSHRARHRPAQLSGGEQQRVAIARAYASGADVVLADEPTANLDARSAAVVVELLCELARAQGRSVVVVTHDPRVAPQCDRVLRLAADGRSLHAA